MYICPENLSMKYYKAILFLLWIFFAACGAKQPGNGKLKVTVTTGMIEDIVLQVGGDWVEVSALMGPGVDPHLYKAGQGDLKKLNNADIVFYNGLHLEGKMVEIFEKMEQSKPVYPVAAAIPKTSLLYPNGQAIEDPHIWFDVSLWKLCVGYVAEKLAAIDTTHAAAYRQNAEKYAKTLDSLHMAVRSEIKQIPPSSRLLLTSHDAFGYFGRAYGLEVKGIQGISTIAEPGIKDMTDLVRFVIEKNVRTVFVESSVSPVMIESLMERARKSGYPLTKGGKLYSDAMGEKGTASGTYVGMMEHNVQQIVEGLR